MRIKGGGDAAVGGALCGGDGQGRGEKGIVLAWDGVVVDDILNSTDRADADHDAEVVGGGSAHGVNALLSDWVRWRGAER